MYHYSGEVKEAYSVFDNIKCNKLAGSFEAQSRKGVKIFSIFTDKNCEEWFEYFKDSYPDSELKLIDSYECK